MRENAVNKNLMERRSVTRRQVDEDCTAEFLIDGHDVTRRLKIWNKSTSSMCLLVKENSDILPRLKVGDTLRMVYHSTDSVYPFGYLGTTIRHITKKDQGQLRGHYLVGMEIPKRQNRRKTH